MASPAPEQFRPLRRVEHDQLVALGTFEGERVDGALRCMNPNGPLHASTVDSLTELLVLALVGGRGCGCGCKAALRPASYPGQTQT